MGYSVANDCSLSSSGDSLCHRDCVTQEILKHCKSQTVALHVCTEKSMSVNVNDQHEGEPQRKDVHPDEHGGDDKPKSEQRLCARPMAGTTAQCWARRAAADPVPSRKGGITTFLLLLLNISSCLSTASRPLKGSAISSCAVRFVGSVGAPAWSSRQCEVRYDGVHPGLWYLRPERPHAMAGWCSVGI
ncbi:hypothetical protein CYMTET_53636 [Cymbomonas tetramitiformis]|uniref:Uncharacterized protein n=1 Tax=Cymbomonas tetramitiformis TaxID=36881 RepID=A0AAE0BGM8_9CHLO|nr:hypothetical protein CYMTET_53636 [Cymbomonas tetramitiformis]